MTAVYSVPGMSCQHCVDTLNREVGGIDGVASVIVDLPTKTVTVELHDESAAGRVRAAIDDAGFEIVV